MLLESWELTDTQVTVHRSSSVKVDQALESKEADPTVRIIWPKNADTVDILGELETEANSPPLYLSTSRTLSAHIQPCQSHLTALCYKQNEDSNLFSGLYWGRLGIYDSLKNT